MASSSSGGRAGGKWGRVPWPRGANGVCTLTRMGGWGCVEGGRGGLALARRSCHPLWQFLPLDSTSGRVLPPLPWPWPGAPATHFVTSCPWPRPQVESCTLPWPWPGAPATHFGNSCPWPRPQVESKGNALGLDLRSSLRATPLALTSGRVHGQRPWRP